MMKIALRNNGHEFKIFTLTKATKTSAIREKIKVRVIKATKTKFSSSNYLELKVV